MRIAPGKSLRGSLELPGDKSISHRYAILGAMSEGSTEILNYSASQDCQSTLNCLQQLGCGVLREGNRVVIQSSGWQRFRQPSSDLDAGNSGTTIRLLSGVLAALPFTTRIHGDSSLNRRPMARIIQPLEQMGARIQSNAGGVPPLTIQGGPLQAIRYTTPVASAQVKSCLLLAGLTARGRTEITEHAASRDHTELALPAFGVPVSRSGLTAAVDGPCQLSGTSVRVPGDFSSAAFLILAALLLPDSAMLLKGIGVNPTRTGLLTLLIQSGAQVEMIDKRFQQNEPVCDLRVSYSRRVCEDFPTLISGQWIPNLIDEIPVLAVLGTRLRKGLQVRDAGELRKKESDRIEATTSNLQAIGIELETFEDGFFIPPGQSIRGGSVRSFGDHRIAMAFAIAGLLSNEGIEIDEPGCVAISFPGFFDELEQLTIQ